MRVSIMGGASRSQDRTNFALIVPGYVRVNLRYIHCHLISKGRVIAAGLKVLNMADFIRQDLRELELEGVEETKDEIGRGSYGQVNIVYYKGLK